MFLQFNAVRFPLPKLNPLIDELLVVEALSEEIPEMPLALEFEDDALLTVLVKREPLTETAFQLRSAKVMERRYSDEYFE